MALCSFLHCFDVQALQLILCIVQRDRLEMDGHAEPRSGNLFEAGIQQHFFHCGPVVKELMIISLPEEGINRLHRRFSGVATATISDQIVRLLQIHSDHILSVRHNNAKDAAGTQNALNFAGDFESIIQREMFKDMLTEYSVKRDVWKRQSAGDIN
jgi:hypothetical protein